MASGRLSPLARMLLLPLPLLLGLAKVAEAQDAEPVDCKHGTWDKDRQACDCDPGWATAGITDTVDFLEGICEQYHCKSDSVCQEILKIPSAQCPVKSWNCYCGFYYSFMNSLHGYEVGREDGGGAECMGFMYAFSVFCSEFVWDVMTHAWKVILALATLALPLGRKRAICDCRRRTMWHDIRVMMGSAPTCHGTCILPDDYWNNCNGFKDDIAWTLYIFDLGLWIYLFLGTLYVIVLFIWSFLLWVLVLLTMVVFMLAAMCMLCQDGAAGCDCNGCGCPQDCGCGDCGCCPTDAGATAPGGAGDMYYAGAFPGDPGFGWYWGSWDMSGLAGSGTGTSSRGGGTCCDAFCPEGSSCRPLVAPLAWLCLVFPRMPENLHGGLVGYYLFGTHRSTQADNLYQGGSEFIDMLAFSSTNDNHDNRDWRRRVHDFLAAPDPAPDRQPLMDQADNSGETGQKFRVGGSYVTKINKQFDKNEHRCVPSSWEDYEKNLCWICQEERPNWDLWLSCRHLFCEKCSKEMLQRRMPCPLCRVASSHVLRGTKYEEPQPQLDQPGEGSNGRPRE